MRRMKNGYLRLFALAAQPCAAGQAQERHARIEGHARVAGLAGLDGLAGSGGLDRGGSTAGQLWDDRAAAQLDVTALAVGVAGIACAGVGGSPGVSQLRAAVMVGGVLFAVCQLADLTYRLGVAVALPPVWLEMTLPQTSHLWSLLVSSWLEMTLPQVSHL